MHRPQHEATAGPRGTAAGEAGTYPRQRLPPPPLSSAGPASEPGGGAAARACFSLLSSYDGVFYSLQR